MPRYCPPADKVELGESAAVNASALPAASSIDDARVGRTPQLLAEIDIAVLKSATSQTMTPSANKRTEAPQVVKSSARKWASDDLFTTPEAQASFTTSAATLSILDQEVASCTRCDELAAKRTQTVFGVGNPKARLCFMGEAPGADEDRLGEPFVGRAGQLLNKIIEACRLKREDVYILNMIKCRPPGNRNPLPHELQNCRSFLDRQLELIEPEFICCLGAVASQNLLNTTTPISKLRGKLHAYREIQVVCTFHPAYLLRNPAAKKDAWEDLKFLMREMGVNL
jgi:DNA polymerase